MLRFLETTGDLIMIPALASLLFSFAIALGVGRILHKFKIPPVLGWLIVGIVLSPFALGLISFETTSASWYGQTRTFLKFIVGTTMGFGMTFGKDEASIQSLKISLSEALGTFALTSGVFALIFLLQKQNVAIALVFGVIAMATSVATALATLNSLHADDLFSELLLRILPISKIIGITIFMLTIAFVTSLYGAQSQNDRGFVAVLFISLLAGTVVGLVFRPWLRKNQDYPKAKYLYLGAVVSSAALFLVLDSVLLQQYKLNSLLAGLAMSMVLSLGLRNANIDRIDAEIKRPIGILFTFFIMTMGTMIDYSVIFQIGLLTIVYMISRTIGKVLFAAVGGKIAGLPKAVGNRMGFLLLPHASSALILTTLATDAIAPIALPDANLVQNVIIASIILNEFIALLLVKWKFHSAPLTNKQ